MKKTSPKPEKPEKKVKRDVKTKFDGTFEELMDIVAPPIKPKKSKQKCGSV